MERVYLYDTKSEEVVGTGKQTDTGLVISDEAVEKYGSPSVVVIPKSEFYMDERVSDEVVPTQRRGTQVHVACMCCGFETVYGVRALIRSSRWDSKRNGYPQRSASCRECGENAWKEVERQYGPCDWSDSFEWADPPEQTA